MIYKLVLSTKQEIPITEREYRLVKENISNSFLELEHGIINPSFVVSILVDETESMLENKRKLQQITTNSLLPEEAEFIKKNYNATTLPEIKKIADLLQKHDKSLSTTE